jgi:hypothetical protein
MDWRTSCCLILVGAALTVPLASSAQVAFTAQDRSANASSRSFGDLWDENSNPFFPDFDGPVWSISDEATDTATASDFGPFDDGATTLDPSLSGFAPNGSAMASQDSAIAQTRITADGGFALAGHSRTLTQGELDLINAFLMPAVPFDFGILSDEENGSSSFSLSFDLTSPTPYTLNGSLALSAAVRMAEFQGFEITTASASIALTGPSGEVASVAIDQADFCDDAVPCVPGADSIDVQGVLDPGSYTLAASVTGTALGGCNEITVFTCYTPGADGSFGLALTLEPPPVPALPPVAALLAAAALAASARSALRSRFG